MDLGLKGRTAIVCGASSGLGLATVHGIVSQLDGALEIKSRVGAGTTISVYIPEARELTRGDFCQRDDGGFARRIIRLAEEAHLSADG